MMSGLSNYRQGLTNAIQVGQQPLNGAGTTINSGRGYNPLTSVIGGLGQSTSSGNGNTMGDLGSLLQQLLSSQQQPGG